jgi:S1-C subfamily serine protease
MQAPHRAVKEAGALPESCGVFVSRWHHGSPAHRYALYALQFVQEVNGMPTPDLETFVQAVSKLVCPPLSSLPCLAVACKNSPTHWVWLFLSEAAS